MHGAVREQQRLREAQALEALRTAEMAPAMEDFHEGRIGVDKLARRVAARIEPSGGGVVEQTGLWREAVLDALTVLNPSWSR